MLGNLCLTWPRLLSSIPACALGLLALAALFGFFKPPRPPLTKSRGAGGKPDTSRHTFACECAACERNGTGAFAMIDAGGDYQRFRALVLERTCTE